MAECERGSVRVHLDVSVAQYSRCKALGSIPVWQKEATGKKGVQLPWGFSTWRWYWLLCCFIGGSWDRLSGKHSIMSKLGTPIVQEELTWFCSPIFQNPWLSCQLCVFPSPGSTLWRSRVQPSSYSTVYCWPEVSGHSPSGDDPREKHGHSAPEANQQVCSGPLDWG